eukprot:10264785-Alexandrium_andersonii.AAC.1
MQLATSSDTQLPDSQGHVATHAIDYVSACAHAPVCGRQGPHPSLGSKRSEFGSANSTRNTQYAEYAAC